MAKAIPIFNSAPDVQDGQLEWHVHPVFAELPESRVIGGVLLPALQSHGPAFVPDPSLAPMQSLELAVESTLAALDWLVRLPEHIWLMVVVDPMALRSERTWWSQLAGRHPDLAAGRNQAGRRLVVGVMQAEGLEEVDPRLMRNLAELHTLALAMEDPLPAAMREPLRWPITRMVLGPTACVGIDANLLLQAQCRFVQRAAQDLHMPLTAVGLANGSELAWFRRQRGLELCGPALAAPMGWDGFMELIH